MNKSEWSACHSPQWMISSLRTSGKHRKLRLFACACCRQAWEVLGEVDPRLQELVEFHERLADDRLSSGELARKRSTFQGGTGWVTAERWIVACRQLARACTYSSAWDAALSASEALRMLSLGLSEEGPEEYDEVIPKLSQPVQADLLRDLFGTLHRDVPLRFSWLGPDQEQAHQLAKIIYQEQSYEDMPVLADALEEAGCQDQHLLDHCRTPGIHARGCWALDSVLGKE